MCENRFLFVLRQNVMYYCTVFSAVFDWIRALQVFSIIIIITCEHYCFKGNTGETFRRRGCSTHGHLTLNRSERNGTEP